MMKNDGYPLVSVVIPSFNHARYVEKAIDSINNQTYKKIELIVIDDGSTDGSQKILKDLQKKYKFNLHLQDNIGLPSTLNRAISEYVSGKYLSICASDDYFHPEKIFSFVKFLEENPSIPVAFSKSEYVDEENKVVVSATNSANKKLKGGKIFREIITQRIHFLPGMIRLDLYNEIGLYDKNIWTEDFDFNLKVSKCFEIGYLDQVLNYYRFPSDFSKKLKTLKVPDAHRKCIDKYRDSKYYSEALIEWSFRNFIWFSGSIDKKIFALKSMFYSIRYCYRISYLKSVFNLVFIWRTE